MPAPAGLLLAALVAAGSLDPVRVALGGALGAGALSGCSAAEAAQVLRDAGISPLGTVAGRRVVLANPHGSCICGNVNCPYLVLQLDPGGTAAVLLSTSGYAVTPAGAAQPLPNLRELAHDSALVSDETIDAYRDGKYVVIGSARIRSDSGARKPNAVPVRFAPGASSAVLSGSVSLGWYDEYALGAQRGQRVTVSGVHAPAKLTFSLTGRTGAYATELRPGVPAVLPADGTYLVHVDGASDDAQPYTAVISIR
jgi:hypothetical protein